MDDSKMQLRTVNIQNGNTIAFYSRKLTLKNKIILVYK